MWNTRCPNIPAEVARGSAVDLGHPFAANCQSVVCQVSGIIRGISDVI
jgi:hypothetical protein